MKCNQVAHILLFKILGNHLLTILNIMFEFWIIYVILIYQNDLSPR